MRRLEAVAVMTAAVLAVATGGCDRKTEPIVITPATYRPLNTPFAPLFNLASAYAHRGVEGTSAYAAIFDSTSYEFVWDDPAEPGLDNSYGYEQEVLLTGRMFSDPAVASISLTFLANASDSVGVPSPVPGDPLDARLITVNGISLSVNRPPVTYTCAGSCDFTVAQTDTIAGVPQWRIIRWVDRTAPPTVAPPIAGPNAVGPTTWGGIKSLYSH